MRFLFLITTLAAQILLPISGGRERPNAPTDSPGAGSYGSTQSVTLSDAGASTILYTTNGSTPACPATGTLYTGAISVAATTTIKAIGCNGVTGGGVLTSMYTISGGNNVAIVSGHLGGGGGGLVASVAFSFAGATVTSGNTIFCGVSLFGGSALTSGMVTKTAGTATVGTITLDQATTNSEGGVYRVPVTGTGTVTLTFNNGSSQFEMMGCGEFSGVSASPLSTHSNSAGTASASHTTNSVITTDVGVLIYTDYEENNNDFTRTYSDQLIFKIDTAGSTFTGITQYKIINASPNTLTDTTGTDASSVWQVAYALYKSS